MGRPRVTIFRGSVLVIDCETTGLEPERHALIELGAVLLDGQTLAERGTFCRRMLPSVGKCWDAAAERVHGISKGCLHAERGTSFVLAEFYAWVGSRDVQIAGWNVAFDVGFLRAASREHGLIDRFRAIDYHAFDVWTAWQAAYIVGATDYPAGSLGKWCAHHGLARSEHHNALEDARLTAEALRRLAK